MKFRSFSSVVLSRPPHPLHYLSDEIYYHLEENDLLPEGQKGCRRNSRCTKDELIIDKAVMKNCKRRKIGLSMVWVDY